LCARNDQDPPTVSGMTPRLALLDHNATRSAERCPPAARLADHRGRPPAEPTARTPPHYRARAHRPDAPHCRLSAHRPYRRLRPHRPGACYRRSPPPAEKSR
jgi:hypothetical protein